MEVDESALEAAPDTAAAAESQALDELSACLTRIQGSPYDYALHEQNISLSRASGLPGALHAARETKARFYPLSEGPSLLPLCWL